MVLYNWHNKKTDQRSRHHYILYVLEQLNDNVVNYTAKDSAILTVPDDAAVLDSKHLTAVLLSI